MRTLVVVTSLLIAGAAQAAAPALVLDPRHSDLVVLVRKKGLFSAFEHDHYLHPRRWSGTLAFDPQRPEAARVQLVIDVGSLSDEQPKLKPDDRAKVEAQIRSPMVLDAQQFPEARFTSERVELSQRGPDELSGTLHGTLALHGRTQPLAIPFHARVSSGNVTVRGHAELDQSRFGIRPLRKGGGVIAVHDRVAIDFTAAFSTPSP